MRRARVLIVLWLLVIAATLFTGRYLLVRLHYLIGSTLVLSFLWTWFNIHGVQLIRQTRSRRAQVGQVAEERFIVRNTGWLPKLWLEVRDGSTLPDHRASRVVNSLPSRRQRGWSVRTFCRRRGRFLLGPITIASGDPLGLFRLERHIPTVSTMIVYPATFDLTGFDPPGGRMAGGGAMRRRAHYITTNVAGVRDYAPGDGFNRIHWPSTARTGRLIVKQFEMDPTADIWIVLDMDHGVQVGEPRQDLPELEGPAVLWAPSLTTQIDPCTEEHGVTLAASLAQHFLTQNRSVGLITYGQEREVVQLDRGERQAAKILETLAVIRAEGRWGLEHVIAAEERSFGRNTTVMVITPSTSGTWVAALRDLKRRGVQVLAVLLEPSTFGPAPSALEVVTSLAANNIPSYLVKCGDDLSTVLRQRTPIGTAQRALAQTW